MFSCINLLFIIILIVFIPRKMIICFEFFKQFSLKEEIINFLFIYSLFSILITQEINFNDICKII